MTSLIVDPRFNGPPASGNGGVVSGLLAATREGPVATVTLRRPPPLGVPMTLTDGLLHDGDELVAEVGPGEVSVVPPRSVGVGPATAAPSALGPHSHPFPTCFVCGPDHPTGLRLLPGRVTDDLVAVPWTPSEGGLVMTWAALDCPGGWSADLPGRPMVLGRMTAAVWVSAEAGRTYVVQGWTRGAEGRKVHTASALYTDAGEVLAIAEQTWITLP